MDVTVWAWLRGVDFSRLDDAASRPTPPQLAAAAPRTRSPLFIHALRKHGPRLTISFLFLFLSAFPFLFPFPSGHPVVIQTWILPHLHPGPQRACLMRWLAPKPFTPLTLTIIMHTARMDRMLTSLAVI